MFFVIFLISFNKVGRLIKLDQMFHLMTVKISTLTIKFIHTINSALLDALKLYLRIKNNLKVL